MYGQTIPAPVGSDEDSLIAWAIVALVAIAVSAWPAVMAWINARQANKAVNDTENGELRISQRVRDLHDYMSVMANMAETVADISDRLMKIERDLIVLKRFHAEWSRLRPPVDNAEHLQEWVDVTDSRLRNLERGADED